MEEGICLQETGADVDTGLAARKAVDGETARAEGPSQPEAWCVSEERPLCLEEKGISFPIAGEGEAGDARMSVEEGRRAVGPLRPLQEFLGLSLHDCDTRRARFSALRCSCGQES